MGDFEGQLKSSKWEQFEFVWHLFTLAKFKLNWSSLPHRLYLQALYQTEYHIGDNYPRLSASITNKRPWAKLWHLTFSILLEVICTVHTEHSWAPAVKMYPFIQKRPLADIDSGGAMQCGDMLCLLVVVLLIKNWDKLRPLFRWSWDSFKNGGIFSLIDEVCNIQSCLEKAENAKTISLDC